MQSVTKETYKKPKSKNETFLKQIKRYKFIYLLMLPAAVLVIIFSYFPMWGIRMAFQNYNVFNPSASTWVGMAHFKEIFTINECLSAIYNTIKISLLSLVICYPITIIFALMLNEVRGVIFKKTIQTISYLPYFMSWISVIGIL